MELITIVHGQKIEYIPIIYEFKEEIKQHTLFFDHSQEDRAFAEEIKKSIEILYAKYNLQTEIKMIEIDEDSKKDMQEIVQILEEKNEIVYLNGAGADTALFTVLSSIVLQNRGKVIAYDKEDNSYNFITKNGFENKSIQKNMNIDDFMILMGEEILEEQDKSKATAQKDALNLLFSDTKKMFSIRNLLGKCNKKELKDRYPDILEALKILGIVDDFYHMSSQGFTKFGYLFEQFIYLQLLAFDFDDIKIGVTIRFDQGQVERCNIDVINEFDILIIHENKIGFVECKIGNTLDPLGTIYKSDSVMEYFGENASSLIVNMERNKTPHLKNTKKNFGQTLIYRAETKKVSIYNAFDFSANRFRVKIREAFGVDLKKEFLEDGNRKSLNELVDKWGK